MESWTEWIEEFLERAPTGAAPFSSILQGLAEGGVAVSGKEDWILQQVGDQESQFKIIPDRVGPWLHWPGPTRPRNHRPWLRESDPWILACRLPVRTGPGEGARFVGRIRESLLAWGQGVDDGSQMSVARWIGANGEAERALNHFLKRRVPPD